MKVPLTILLLFSAAFSISAQSTWKAPSTARIIKSPCAGNATDLKAAKKIFTEMCVICHGLKGKGDGIAAAALNPKPANYTSKTVQDQTDGELFWKITNGNAPTAAMAAYKDILTEKQRWQLVAYIRTFKK